jgi:hypothetical protein
MTKTKITKNCLKKFKQRHVTYPSIIEIRTTNCNEKIETFFIKYKILWRSEVVNSDFNQITIDKLIDYDPTGIMVYIKGGNHIFILTTETNMDVSKLTLSRLKKLLKEDGNNGRTT